MKKLLLFGLTVIATVTVYAQTPCFNTNKLSVDTVISPNNKVNFAGDTIATTGAMKAGSFQSTYFVADSIKTMTIIPHDSILYLGDWNSATAILNVHYNASLPLSGWLCTCPKSFYCTPNGGFSFVNSLTSNGGVGGVYLTVGNSLPDAELNVTGPYSGNLLFSATNSSGDVFTIDHNGNTYAAGNVGIGTTSPDAQLNIKAPASPTTNAFSVSNSSGDLFAIDAYGNITSFASGALLRVDGNFLVSGSVNINNVGYNFPASQAASSGYVLSNDGSGNLSWVAPSGGGGGQTLSYSGYTLSISGENSVTLPFNSSGDFSPSTLDLVNNAVIENADELEFANGVDISVDGGSTIQCSANFSAGDVECSGSSICSDARFKTNIQDLKGSLANVLKLQGHTFEFDTKKFPKKLFKEGERIGFIAQEVLKVYPQLVEKDPDGYYLVDYAELTPALVEAIKEQQHIIDSLGDRLNSIDSCVSKLCSALQKVNYNEVTTPANVQQVTLNSINQALLYQNIPNPFGSGGTKINYFLPEGTMGASIVFYDNYGNKLKEVELSQTGMGTINIDATQMSNGIYSYSLIINGQIVDTKKMVLAK